MSRHRLSIWDEQNERLVESAHKVSVEPFSHKKCAPLHGFVELEQGEVAVVLDEPRDGDLVFVGHKGDLVLLTHPLN